MLMDMKGPGYFELQCDDLVRASKFYGFVFGWSFAPQQDMPVEYMRITTKGMQGGLLKRIAPLPDPESCTNAAIVSMEVPDFDRAAGKITEKGGQVVLPKFAVAGRCWQGYFEDTEGNLFGIFEVDEAAR